jgi:Abnormal spindle-like microcephaly-assoc'd, ASPM-SPD-2-Hydin/HYDIN/CFA65/VesB-like, Ig-like domain/Cep192 domain 4
MKNHADATNCHSPESTTQRQTKAPFRRSLSSLLATLAVILTAITLSNCAGYTSASSTGTGTSTPGAGVLAASATTLAFGSVPMGSSAVQSLSVTNTGTSAVDVTQATISGAGFSVTSGNGAATLAVGQSATIQVQFAPASSTAATGSLVVTSDASNPTLTIALSGTAAEPGISVTPSSVSFGNVADGTTATQAITLKNTGTADLVISSDSVTGTGFGVTGFTAQTLTANSSMTFNATFAPTSTGTVSGSISVSTNLAGSPTTIPLSGTGTQAGMSVTPSSVSFGNVADGTTATQGIVLKNTGTANLIVSSESVTGTGFSVTGFTAQTLAPSSTMTFNAVFTPASAGAASGSISVSTNLTGSPTTIPLSGTGTQPGMSLTPSSVTFGNVADGTNATQLITLQNTGTANLVVSSASATGAGFSVTGFTAQTLAPGNSMSFTAVFAPASAGSVTGSISVATNLTGSPTAIPLSGTGTQPGMSVTPSSVSFGNVAVGTGSTQAITLKNTGTANLTVSSESATGAGFSVVGFTAQTLTPGSSMSFNAVFTPTSAGAASGSISVSTNLPASPTAIALTGTGAQPAMSITPSSVSFGSVADGSNSSQIITVQNTGTVNLVVSSATATGTGFSVTGFTAQTVTSGNSMTFNAVFAPTSAGSASGSVSLSTNVPGSPTSIALTGTGTQPAMSATPSSVTFGSVVDGTNNSQTITLKNTGTANLVVSSDSVSGTGFSVTGFVAQTLTPNTSMTFNAVFAPTSAGSVSGSVSVNTNAPGSPTVINLSGTGAAATFVLGANPTTLNFGSVNVGNSSSLPVTLTNNGNSNITISGIGGATGAFSTSGVGAGTTLTPTQSTTLNVAFTPAAAGGASGTITVASNSTTAPSISVSGTGAAAAPSVSLSWAPSSSTDVVGYNVYRGTTSGGPYTKLTPSPISSALDTDSTVSSGNTYYYVVTAVDSSQNESADSNQATASIP